ncbi:MAG: hypothetical protein ACRYG8_41140 [Janthinobacterium lividum]
MPAEPRTIGAYLASLGDTHAPNTIRRGFAAALRRSELVGLKVSDITATRDGLEIRLGRSKTDQDEKGASISLPRGEHRRTCPVRALQEWQQVAKRSAGSLAAYTGIIWQWWYPILHGPVEEVGSFAAISYGPKFIPWRIDDGGFEDDVLTFAFGGHARPTARPHPIV